MTSTKCVDYLFVVPKDCSPVPPCCAANTMCPMNKESCVNNSSQFDKFGRFGFSFLARNRKLVMGLLSVMTVINILTAFFAAFGISDDATVLQTSYWDYLLVHNRTSGEDLHIYFGLSSFSSSTSSSNATSFSNTTSFSTSFSSVAYASAACEASLVSPSCAACASPIMGFWMCSLMSVIGSCLSLLSLHARANRTPSSINSNNSNNSAPSLPYNPPNSHNSHNSNSLNTHKSPHSNSTHSSNSSNSPSPVSLDDNSQKLVAVLPEVVAAFLTLSTVMALEMGCVREVKNSLDSLNEEVDFHAKPGPDLFIVASLIFSCLLRAAVHLLTPTVDGDGEFPVHPIDADTVEDEKIQMIA